MDSAHKTLIDIANVSQRVSNTLDRLVGRKTVDSSRLDKIVVGVRIVLEALNKAFLLKDSNTNDRLMGWLDTDEPQACLRTLNQIEGILNKKDGYGIKSFLKVSWPTQTQDKVGEAIKLFRLRKASFHLLLETGIQIRESGAQRLSPLTAQLEIVCANPAPNEQRLVASVHSRNSNTVNVIQAQKVSVTERNQGVDLGKLDGILEWLDAWDPRGTHERMVFMRQPDTCTWLLKMSEYKRWRGARNSFLWLHGKPGAGKSVLAASVIEDLRSTLQDGEVLAYFYCDFREERSASVVEMLRSLLSQLIQRLRHSAVDPGDLINKLVEERRGGNSTINNATLLARHISCAAKWFHIPPLLVIDALDECKEIEELLDSLTRLWKSDIRLLAISRPLQIIKDAFSGHPFIDMELMNHKVSGDIRLHVERELDSHRRLRVVSATLREEIYSTLCKKAGGMFRWVQCQLTTLKRCVTLADFRKTLNNLPSDLDETYGRILLEIDKTKESRNVARRVLGWLVVALQPLRLSEIMEGLSVDVGRRVLNVNSVPVHETMLLDALGSLVIHDEVSDTVILSHFSVKEYLIAASICNKHPAYHVDQRATHTQLALHCIYHVGIVLRHCQKSDSYEASPRHTYNLTESHPLLQYTLSVGFSHLEHVNPRNKAILRAIKEFELGVGRHPLEWEQLCKRTGRSHISDCTSEHDLTLYILTAFASEPLLHSSIGRGKLCPKTGTNPLVYAAHFDKIEHAQTLLSRGADLNCRGLGVMDSRQVLPLEAAVQSRNCNMVDLLLDEGSHVPYGLFEDTFTNDVHPHNPRIDSKLLQTDEFVDWALVQHESVLLHIMFDRYRYSPPSEQDYMDIIQRRLVQIGCNPSTRLDEVSLRHAVSSGRIYTIKHMLSQKTSFPSDIILNAAQSTNSEMIRLFLDLGYTADVATRDQDTPIHLALMSGFPDDNNCFESVRVLVDAGCNPSACNLDGRSPLHLAAWRGYISVVNYLLSLQVPLPPDILLEASGAAVTQLLIRRGADVHVVADDGEDDGDTPLHYVLRGTRFSSDESLECVKMLVKAGCDPRLSNALGETPLDVAVKHICLPVVQYLLSIGVPLSPRLLLDAVTHNSLEIAAVVRLLIDTGTDVHTTRPNGDTLLHLVIAVEPSSDVDRKQEVNVLRTVKMLVGAGCDPSACNSAGKTPLHVAVSRRYISVMKYLLSLGILLPSGIMSDLLQRSTEGLYPATCFLLDEGGDIRAISKEGDTLLHSAAGLWPEQDALDLVQLFVHAGCNPSLLNSRHEMPLHIAARQGYVSIGRYFLSLGMSLPTDILLAASMGHSRKRELICYLIDESADISVITADGDTPLHLLVTVDYLAESDGLECTKILIGAGCDPRTCNIAGKTPLHAAAEHGYASIVRYFLSLGISLPPDILLMDYYVDMEMIRCFIEEGADVSVITVDGDTPLHLLMSDGDEDDRLECTKILIDAGCDPRARNTAGETPLHAAAKCGFTTILECLLAQGIPLPDDILRVSAPRTIRFLFEKGVDVCCVTANVDMQLLHRALGGGLDEDCLECAKILVGAGWDVSSRNSSGETPIHIAAGHDRFSAIKYLLSQGAPLPPDVLLATFRGRRLFSLSALSLTHFFIRKEASVNTTESNGDTPLHHVLRLFDTEDTVGDHMHRWAVIEMLLDGGADPYARNTEGETPLDIAAAHGHFFKANFPRLVSNSLGRTSS